MTVTRARVSMSSSLIPRPTVTSSPRISIHSAETPQMEVVAVLSRACTSMSKALCSRDTRRTFGISAAMAAASSKVNVGSTEVRDGMPRVRAEPGWTLIRSKVPTMRLNWRMVSCRVASPTDAMATSEAMPTATPSSMNRLRRGLRRSVRSASASVLDHDMGNSLGSGR
jgi:hypothetical protein